MRLQENAELIPNHKANRTASTRSGCLDVILRETMRNLIIMATFFSIFTRLWGEQKPPVYEVAEIYTGLRSQVLNLDEKESGWLKDKPVYAVLVEMGRPDGVITVVAIADGTASLYFSKGGGMIGLGEHENVRPKSVELVNYSESQLKNMDKVEDYPLPMPGEVRFYAVTPNGTFTAKTKERELEKPNNPLHKFYAQTHDLITQMRIADEIRQTEQEH